MNKLLTTIVGAVLGTTMSIGVGIAVVKSQDIVPAHATEELYYTLDGTSTGGSNGYATESELTQDGITWMATGNTTISPWRIGGKNLSGVDRPIYSTTAMGSAITKVEVSIGSITLTAVNSLKMIVASDADFANTIDEITKTSCSANSTLTFNPTSPSTNWATSAYYKFVFNVDAGGSNAYVQFNKADFYREAGGSTPEKALSSIAVSGSMTKTSYKTTDSWNPAGLVVTATYDDNSTKDVTSSAVWSYSPASPSSTSTTSVTATATYTENEVEKNASSSAQAVTVTDKGTSSNPLTVSEVWTIASGLASNANNGEILYATGTVSGTVETNSYGGSFNITDGVKTVKAYSITGVQTSDSSAEGYVAAGYTVVLTGVVINHATAGYEIGFATGYQTSLVSSTAPVISNYFDVTFDTNGGNASPEALSVGDGLTFLFPSAGANGTNVFKGWSSDNIAFYQEGDTSPAVEDDIEYTAYWQTKGSSANPYTVSEARSAITNNTGVKNVYATGIVSSIVTAYNSQYSNISFNFSSDGETNSNQLEAYRCSGTDAANVAVGDTVVVSGNLKKHNDTYEFDSGCTLVSLVHPQVTTYTVTYNANGGSGDVPVDNTEYASGAQVTVLGNIGSTPLTKEGYTWSGWNTQADGQGTTYTTGDEFEITTNTILYAKWTENSTPTPSGDGEWVSTAITELASSDVFVIVGDNGNTYAMSNDNAASNPPDAVEVTISDDDKITSTVADNIKWNISGNGTDGYTFYPNGSSDTWLYTTTSNNGVRVGTNANKTFIVDSGYLKNTSTNRYVGIYSSQDWRCYTTINSNITGQTFAFYKYVESATPTPTESSIVSGTFEYNSKQSVFVDDIGTMVVKAPEGCEYLMGVYDENNAFYGSAGDDAVYDSITKTASFDYAVDSTAASDVVVKFYWYASDGYSNYTEVEETIQIINPTGLSDARDFASSINEVCHASSKDYETLADLYELLSPEAQAWLLNADYTVTGTGDNTVVTKADNTHYELAEAMSRYDYMVEHYSMPNFMNKDGLSSMNNISALNFAQNEGAITTIIVLSLLSFTTIGGYFLLRKKKED